MEISVILVKWNKDSFTIKLLKIIKLISYLVEESSNILLLRMKYNIHLIVGKFYLHFLCYIHPNKVRRLDYLLIINKHRLF